MHKKIKLLMNQALASSLDQGGHLDDFAEIFAKLIIDQCITICYEAYDNDVADEYGDGPLTCADEIKEFFGLDS